MFAFFLFEAHVRHESAERIFREIYFEPRWQVLFDACHSIPIFLLIGGWFLWRRNRAGMLFTASLLLHSLVDWPTHLEDAHAYFWPIWRRPLPGLVSYWHPGSRFWILEVAILAAAVAFWIHEKITAPARPPAPA